MNHKRRRPKNARAGCLLCGAHKMNGAKLGIDWVGVAEARARISEREQVAPREWDEGDLSYADDYWCDAGWCDAGDCVICNGGDVRTPPLRRPLLARAA